MHDLCRPFKCFLDNCASHETPNKRYILALFLQISLKILKKEMMCIRKRVNIYYETRVNWLQLTGKLARDKTCHPPRTKIAKPKLQHYFWIDLCLLQYQEQLPLISMWNHSVEFTNWIALRQKLFLSLRVGGLASLIKVPGNPRHMWSGTQCEHTYTYLRTTCSWISTLSHLLAWPQTTSQGKAL